MAPSGATALVLAGVSSLARGLTLGARQLEEPQLYYQLSPQAMMEHAQAERRARSDAALQTALEQQIRDSNESEEVKQERIKALPSQLDGTSDEMIVTTAYWRLDNKDADQGGLRNGPGSYVRRMHLVMGLNVPIIAYGDNFGVSNMRTARGNTTPELVDAVEMPLEDLPPCQLHKDKLRGNITKYTHILHMPSISIGCVWDGKFSLIGRTAVTHPEYGWYAWLDIGMHGGQALENKFVDWGSKPWPNPERLKTLPRDKITASRTFACQTCKEGQYVPFCHCLAATAFIIPREIVLDVVHFFYDTLDKCLLDTLGRDDGYPCMSEQVIMTQMELRRPGLYNIIGKGYGDVAGKMISEFADLGGSDSSLFDWLSGDDATPRIMLNQVD